MNNAIEEHWESFRAEILPDTADPAVLEKVRAVYYSGAMATFEHIVTILAAAAGDPVLAGVAFTQMKLEFDMFLQSHKPQRVH